MQINSRLFSTKYIFGAEGNLESQITLYIYIYSCMASQSLLCFFYYDHIVISRAAYVSIERVHYHALIKPC